MNGIFICCVDILVFRGHANLSLLFVLRSGDGTEVCLDLVVTFGTPRDVMYVGKLDNQKGYM